MSELTDDRQSEQCPWCKVTYYAEPGHDPLKHHLDYCPERPESADDDDEPADALELAKSELAEAMVPDPEDLLADVGPLAQLFYLNQTAYQVLKNYAAMLTAKGIETPADDSEPVRALQMVAEACGMLDGACQELSILPREAADDAAG